MNYEQAEKQHEQIDCVITRLRIESNTLMRIQEEKKHSYLKENDLAIETGGNLIWQDCDPNVCLLQEALLSIRNAIDQLNMMSAAFYLTPKPKPEPLELTAIFRGCTQDGMEHWSDYAITRNIPLTAEQERLLTPPQGMNFSELILEKENDNNDEL